MGTISGLTPRLEGACRRLMLLERPPRERKSLIGRNTPGFLNGGSRKERWESAIKKLRKVRANNCGKLLSSCAEAFRNWSTDGPFVAGFWLPESSDTAPRPPLEGSPRIFD